MKKIEDDPQLEFNVEDPEEIQTMYRNAVFVDQKLVDGVDLDRSTKGGRIWYREKIKNQRFMVMETNSLSRAMFIAFCWSAERFGWSIVLAGGLYIDPHLSKWNIPDLAVPANSEVEIYGKDTVRVLFTGDWDFKQHSIGTGKLTIRSLRIYDMRDEAFRGIPFFSVKTGAQLDLIDVKVTTPKVGFLHTEKNSTATLKKCSMYSCLHAIMNDGAKVEMEDCLLSHCGDRTFRTIGLRFGGSLTANRVCLMDCSRVLAWTDSHLTFNDCRFELDVRGHYAAHADSCKYGNCSCVSFQLVIDFALFDVSAGATVTCDNCDFRGYDAVTSIGGSGVKVSVKRSRISAVVGIAEVKENASMEVVDCYVDTVYLMKIGYNVKGKIEFEKNKFSGTTKRWFLVDDMSKPLLAHLKGFKFKPAYFPNVCFKAYDKQQSDYTKKFIKGRMKAPADKNPPIYNTLMMKHCAYCVAHEGQDALLSHTMGQEVPTFTKFRFCSKCRQVCYCSRECQSKHWRDHKLSCPDRAKSNAS